MTRGENVDDGLWKEMTEEVQKKADRLFKMTGEAYSVLSDPTKVWLSKLYHRVSLLTVSIIYGRFMRLPLLF